MLIFNFWCISCRPVTVYLRTHFEQHSVGLISFSHVLFFSILLFILASVLIFSFEMPPNLLILSLAASNLLSNIYTKFLVSPIVFLSFTISIFLIFFKFILQYWNYKIVSLTYWNTIFIIILKPVPYNGIIWISYLVVSFGFVVTLFLSTRIPGYAYQAVRMKIIKVNWVSG